MVASDCATIYVLSRCFCDSRKVPSDAAIDDGTNANGYCKASAILLDLDRCSPEAWQSSFTIETFLLLHFFGQSCVQFKLLYGINEAHTSIYQAIFNKLNISVISKQRCYQKIFDHPIVHHFTGCKVLSWPFTK